MIAVGAVCFLLGILPSCDLVFQVVKAFLLISRF